MPIERNQTYKTKKLWWDKTKVLVTSMLNHYTPAYVMVKSVWRKGKWTFQRNKWELQRFFHSGNKDSCSEQTYWVSPTKIIYIAMKEFDYGSFKGKVIGGDWDLLINKFEDLDVYIAFKQVFMDGREWVDTLFYKRIINRLNRGEIFWGCRNEEDFAGRCKELEKLHQTIKREGYKSQEELSQSITGYDRCNYEDEVTICIGRFGDLLFSNGAHRLAIAKMLGIDRIPVKIAVRHSNWLKFKKELYSYVQDEGGCLYQPALHPDLHDISAFHSCKDRFSLIRDNILTKRGNLVDIGANLGYFCHMFEEEGFRCFAVENSEKELYFLRKIKRAENKQFVIVPESILESKQIRDLDIDVMLALNVFHHFLKSEDSYMKLVDLLQTVHVKEAFFEPHLIDDLQMENAYKNFSPIEFSEFLLEHLRLNHAEKLGEATDGRPIYHLF
jgi:hypothetical protein